MHGLHLDHARLDKHIRQATSAAFGHRPRRAQGLLLDCRPGASSQVWFRDFHGFTMYVKVAFLRGTSRRSLLPGESKHKEVRNLTCLEDRLATGADGEL